MGLKAVDRTDTCAARWPRADSEDRGPRPDREAGADASAVHEPLAVVSSHEQRAQPVLRPLLIGEAPDHEETTLKALDLSPAVPAPRLIRQVAPLGDDPFEPHAARLVEDVRPAPFDVLGVADASRLRRSEQRLQSGLRSLREVGDRCVRRPDEPDRRRSTRVPCAVGGSRHGLLHRLEAAAAVRKHHDQFAIDQRVLHAECADGFGDLGKLRRPVESISADQPDAAVRDQAADAIAIELDLVDPLVARWRVLRERRELRDVLRGAPSVSV